LRLHSKCYSKHYSPIHLNKLKVSKLTPNRFNPNPNSKLARTFFGSGRVDFGSGAPLAPPTPPTPLPDPELPLFNPGLISEKVLEDLPAGYAMRPLCRGDYHRGYMEVLRVVGRTGWVGEDIWDERCEWLRTQGSTYYILVVVNQEDRVVASGTVLLERKFIHNMGVVGHIEDLAVARDQKGKKMGLRILEALVHIANSHGAYKVCFVSLFSSFTLLLISSACASRSVLGWN
jgi:glucosamine-phosphate N-acetyltransferase